MLQGSHIIIPFYRWVNRGCLMQHLTQYHKLALGDPESRLLTLTLSCCPGKNREGRVSILEAVPILLRIPWTARRSDQSILKEINPEYSLEGLLLKLKLQYFGHMAWRANSLEKTLRLGKIEGRRKRGWQRMRCLDGIISSMDMSSSKLLETEKARRA